MSVRAIDDNRDWQFGQSKQSYKVGIEETAQMIKTRVLSFLGDCFFATQEGIDWLNLLGKGAQKEEDLKKSVRNFWNGAVKIISFVPGVPWILPNYRQIWLSTIWTSFLVL